MGWADHYIEKLKRGESVQFRPRGNSMSGRIEDGELVTVVPISGLPRNGDVVLCSVKGVQYLHLVKRVVNAKPTRVLIGNNHGKINGWTKIENVYGVAVKM